MKKVVLTEKTGDKQLEDYDIQKESWYSPSYILEHFEKLRAYYGGLIVKSEFRRARELYTSAITLLGAYQLSPENIYFLQANNQNDSPDVMAVVQTEAEGKIFARITQMEIVDFDQHSSITDVVEFLRQTKLSPRKSYGEYTTLVCAVDKAIPIDHKDISRRIRALNPKSTIYIVGRHGKVEDETFSIFTPFPRLTKIVSYHIPTTIAQYSIPPRVDFHLGTDSKVSYTPKQVKALNTYEILGLDEARIKGKYTK
jgi:hypothetical protein